MFKSEIWLWVPTPKNIKRQILIIYIISLEKEVKYINDMCIIGKVFFIWCKEKELYWNCKEEYKDKNTRYDACYSGSRIAYNWKIAQSLK